MPLNPRQINKFSSPIKNTIFSSLFFRYFSQIDEDLLKQILEIYQLDFELFGYNSTVYYNYVKPSSTTATSSVASSGANNRRKRTNHKSSKKLSNHHNF